MTALAAILLGVSVALLLYVHLLYPVVMAMLARIRSKEWQKDEQLEPTVSIILAVFNEEKVIEECINGLLQLDYPTSKVEILVGSDGSKDATNAILTRLGNAHSSIKPFFFTQQRGKCAVVNDLVKQASGEILLFTDADIVFPKEEIWLHVRHYATKEVGGVSGSLAFQSHHTDGLIQAESDYLSMELRLRLNEAKVHSTVGIFGGNYSIRRELWRPLPSDPVCDELYCGLSIIERGFRIIFDETALSYELYGRTMQDEFKRKVRFSARGLITMTHFPRLLGISGGVIALMLWSHKIIRWMTPFLLAGVVVASVLGVISTQNLLYTILLGLSSGILGISVLGYLLEQVNTSIPGVKQVQWFVAMNIAFAKGIVRFFSRKEKPTWVPPTRVAVHDQGGGA